MARATKRWRMPETTLKTLPRWLAGAAWRSCYPWIVSFVWDRKLPGMDARWSAETADYDVLAEIFRECSVGSVLDVGCGSGRLFPLYARFAIHAVGVDISAVALSRARERFPSVPTIRASVVTLSQCSLPHVDLAVSNRVLQHVPRKYIDRAATAIAGLADCIYINEYRGSEGRAETWWMFRHDYDRLFGVHGLVVKRSGRIGGHTWALYGRGDFLAHARSVEV
jgi:SAM-dependent methyltransferase